MRRLLILVAVFLMIVFNGIAFNVLADSHGHDEVTATSGKVKNSPEKDGHGITKSMDDMEKSMDDMEKSMDDMEKH